MGQISYSSNTKRKQTPTISETLGEYPVPAAGLGTFVVVKHEHRGTGPGVDTKPVISNVGGAEIKAKLQWKAAKDDGYDPENLKKYRLAGFTLDEALKIIKEREGGFSNFPKENTTKEQDVNETREVEETSEVTEPIAAEKVDYSQKQPANPFKAYQNHHIKTILSRPKSVIISDPLITEESPQVTKDTRNVLRAKKEKIAVINLSKNNKEGLESENVTVSTPNQNNNHLNVAPEKKEASTDVITQDSVLNKTISSEVQKFLEETAGVVAGEDTEPNTTRNEKQKEILTVTEQPETESFVIPITPKNKEVVIPIQEEPEQQAGEADSVTPTQSISTEKVNTPKGEMMPDERWGSLAIFAKELLVFQKRKGVPVYGKFNGEIIEVDGSNIKTINDIFKEFDKIKRIHKSLRDKERTEGNISNGEQGNNDGEEQEGVHGAQILEDKIALWTGHTTKRNAVENETVSNQEEPEERISNVEDVVSENITPESSPIIENVTLEELVQDIPPVTQKTPETVTIKTPTSLEKEKRAHAVEAVFNVFETKYIAGEQWGGPTPTSVKRPQEAPMFNPEMPVKSTESWQDYLGLKEEESAPFFKDFTNGMSEKDLITKYIPSYVDPNNPSSWASVSGFSADRVLNGPAEVYGLMSDARIEISNLIKHVGTIDKATDFSHSNKKYRGGKLYNYADYLIANPKLTIHEYIEEVKKRTQEANKIENR